MNLPTKHDLELWAIQAARGATKLEREMAATNLYAAARAFQRHLELAEAKAATREMLMRDLAAQMTSFAERWGALDKPAIAAVPGVAVQAPGQTPNEFPVRGEEPATLVPCRLVKTPEGA